MNLMLAYGEDTSQSSSSLIHTNTNINSRTVFKLTVENVLY